MIGKEKNYKGKTAILVDDDIDFIEIIKIYLESFGFSVVTASSFEEGEKLINEVTYDLAIFDLMMENADSGFVLSYSSKKKYPDIPVLILTNVVNETGLRFDTYKTEKNSWIKADSVLNKSIRIEQLRKEVDKVFA
ncbi:MAG: response regulator [Lentisphaerota bacterium]